MKKISVLIPTYNRGALIKEALDSALDQTYPAFEIIVADDGSSDNTREIVLGINDKRIKYHYLSRSGHLPAIRNTAARLSSGDYLAFLDSDDRWQSQKLEKCVEACEKNGAQICLSDCREFSAGGEAVKTAAHAVYDKKNVDLKQEVLFNNLPLTYGTNIFCSRGLFERLAGFDENFFHGDHDFVCRALCSADSIFVKETLNYIRKHADNMSLLHRFDHRPYEEYNLTLGKLRNSMGSADERTLARIRAKNHYQASVSYMIKSGCLGGLQYTFSSFKPFCSRSGPYFLGKFLCKAILSAAGIKPWQKRS